jgi:hypothetical protein
MITCRGLRKVKLAWVVEVHWLMTPLIRMFLLLISSQDLEYQSLRARGPACQCKNEISIILIRGLPSTTGVKGLKSKAGGASQMHQTNGLEGDELLLGEGGLGGGGENFIEEHDDFLQDIAQQ